MKKKQFRNMLNLPFIAMTMSAGTALAGTTAPVTAPIEVPDWLKVSGYAAVTYGYTDTNSDFFGDSNNDTFFDAGTPLDAVKFGLEATQGPFTAYVSLFYSPTPDVDTFGSGGDAGILDAYVTYKTGDFSITAGKYISWLGYEAFDTVNMTQITYANAGLGAIPGYHTGVKFEYVTETFGAGINVSDSLRGGDGFWKGDEDYGNGLGYEAYAVYKGIDKLTLWGGVGFDDTDGAKTLGIYDVWASYDVTDKLTLAAELVYAENTTDGFYGSGEYIEGFQGLLFAKYSFTEKFSTVFRFGFDNADYVDFDADLQAFKYTISPSYAFNEHFTLRAEVSYTDAKIDGEGDSADTNVLFAGVQALLKF